MNLEVGNVLTGKVTGITKFGAFVSLAPGKSGLVHISEIADSYVGDVNEFLSENQEVTVKIIGIDASGRINLSIKQAKEPKKEEKPVYKSAPIPTPAPKSADQSFEDKLKRFMQDSDSKISSMKQYSDRKTKRRPR